MKVYSLIARTRSEIRDVLLSISFSRFAISTEAAILTSAARAVSASRAREQRFQRLRLDVLARQIGRQLPQVVLPVTAQQGINLIFQIADGERICGTFVRLGKEASSFSISDFCAGVRSRLPSSWLASLIFFRMSRKLTRGALGGRSGIVEFMSQSSRKLSQRGQSVALLFHPSGFADPVGHQAHQTLGQFRHLLHQIGKQRGRKSQGAAIGRLLGRSP